ncbi:MULTISPECIES: lipid IV(A) palmitoyltransferase PagP [Serratia]|uniref:Lipid A acyltransferase PagP n=1 Tax=Serratia fonticola TaxID=47917 RepID=A0AAE7EK33_SERFO|nr:MULTISPECIES: lipid IV(A) palmitoyltransferase PagP [Serratia]MBC3217694.1 lipid IV(A) palmitoyltransferase PagP [Serratia fonticola]QKJ60299.2 lipid IV(A) palmitoyltransferase PagP [Serratia fonticola]
MVVKRILLAGGVALIFPALPSYAEVSAENSNVAHAEDPGWWGRFTGNVAETWNNSPNKELYLPAITWHNRWTYDKEKTDEYNERPWGAGYGISRFDADGDWHAIYLMAFKDSFNKWEPIGGYAYEKIWRPIEGEDFRLGLGFTASVTARDNWKYIPIPAPLPLASIGYKQLTFQATYIPGTYNNGNVFFAWLRWQF